jgi:hypothetical protein
MAFTDELLGRGRNANMAWTMARRRRKDADGLVLFVEYLYSGAGDKGGGIRLHIAEFPKLVLAARGFFSTFAAVTEVGR